MNKKIRVKVIVGLVLVIFLANGFLIANSNKVSAKEDYMALKARLVNWNQKGISYFNLIKQHLARIGIDLKIEILPIMALISWDPDEYRNFDMTTFGISDYRKNLNLAEIFRENSSLNVAGYHTSMDWDKDLGTGKNEWYLQQGKQIMPPNSVDRIQHYHDWQNYMMDELLLVQPLFNYKEYVQYWKTLNGYDNSEGIIQSWGKMSWTAPHFGQLSTNEVVISDSHWSDLNPISQDDTSSSFISESTMDPLIYYDADLSVWSHLAESYTMLNDTTLQINTRSGIKWAVDPDESFPDEYFDIEDVYFTLYAWKYLSNDQQDYDWIQDMKITDSNSLIIYIDGDPNTQENEPYNGFLQYLSVNMLPEHYLNQTQDVIGKPDIMHTSWNAFSNHCFGTGLFEIETFSEGIETILSVRDDYWGLNTTITGDPALDFEERFGDFSGDLTQLRIRIIPSISHSHGEFDLGRIDISPRVFSKTVTSEDYAISSKLPMYESFLIYNVRENREHIGSREPCKDDPSITKGLALRKAISYAIDRVEINDIVHGGDYIVTDSPIYEALGIWCNPNIIRYDHDLEKAKYYMELAGYTDTVVTGFEFAESIYFILFVPIICLGIKMKKKSERDKQ